MTQIELTKGQVALIDDEDAAAVSKYSWCAQQTGGKYYAVTSIKDDSGKFQRVYLHRFLMNPPEGLIVDHKDGNGLNNQKDNLRVCTYSQNTAAGKAFISRARKSQYLGVGYVPNGKKHWKAQLRTNGTYTYLGVFDSELEAARARDAKVLELYGEFATLNFPIEADGQN